MKDLPKQIARLALYAVGLGSVTAMIYLAGPLISFGGFRPLESYLGQGIAILVICSLIGSFEGFRFFKR